jgi:hypothetical protein
MAHMSPVHAVPSTCVQIYINITVHKGKVHRRTGHEGPEEGQIYTLPSTSALDGGPWSTPSPGRFTHGKDPVPIVKEAGWAPGPVWTGAENLAPTGIRSPDRPARIHTKPKSSKWCLSFGRTDHNPVNSSVLRNTRYMPSVSHLSWFLTAVIHTWGTVQRRIQLFATVVLKQQRTANVYVTININVHYTRAHKEGSCLSANRVRLL